jgi:DNA-binding response OmpR family regulator
VLPGGGSVIVLSSPLSEDGAVRILVVEDHAVLANTIAEGLRDVGMAVDICVDGASAIESATLTRYDVVVLDRDLPIVHGDAVCAALVAGPSEARILMLTAAAGVDDRVAGLTLGADDYLPKPFAFEELLARVRSLARRSPSPPPLLVRGDLVLDRARARVSRNGQPVELTAKEFGVLEVLCAADGAVVSAEELFERAWDERTDPFSNVVAVTVGRLRRKLGDPPLIETVTALGYRL